MPSLTFLGAARTVTGSKHLVHTGGQRVLVDCGLFQGLKELRQRNWADLPVPATDVQAVVLTHAHLDHVGYLPRLVAQGFRGRIFCTPGTMDLAKLVLADAAKLQEEDARRANQGGYSKHDPALPLYTIADAWRAISQLQPVGFDRPMPVAPGVQVRYVPMGHLLGAAAVIMDLADSGLRLVFGGDLGRYDRPVLRDPEPIAEADVLLIESTYGDRLHEPGDGGARLAQIVKDTFDRGGRLIIPAFAIGRVEEVLYWIRMLEDAHRIPVLPVYLDSPMAQEALQHYVRRADELDPDISEQGRKIGAFATARFTCVTSAQQSSDLARSSKPSIVVSSSGMATGGRVLNHLSEALPDPRNTVLFVGYQAAGTRGRQLVDGARQVKIYGRSVEVQARIETVDGMSAHADAGEIVRWLRGFSRAPRRTFIVHGEPRAQAALQERIGAELGWATHAPEQDEQIELT